MRLLTALDDLLEPLHRGIWEVAVPKELVTVPLDTGWERSSLNIPSPGTVASYRKGQYHVHETATEWRVHLDRKDPKVHPVLHLIDDAPFLLMIGGTFLALLSETRHTKDTDEALEDQKTTWQMMVVIGCAMMLAGLFIGLNPFEFFRGIITIVLPLIIVGLGLSVILKSIGVRPGRNVSGGRTLLGFGTIAIGATFFFLPDQLIAGFILLVLALWNMSSGVVSLRRLAGGRHAVPEGFFRWLLLALLSLLLALAIFLAPQAVLVVLINTVAIIVFLLGIVLIGDGLGLRRMMIMRKREGIST